MAGEKKNIESVLSTQYHTLVESNRLILTSIVDVIILCGQQNIALRGHTEDTSNFKAILQMQAKHNGILKKHLEEGDPRSTYISPQVQNELIGICGKLISDDITQACNEAGVFGFMADEATDAATMEQMALCVRFLDQSSNSVREEFLGFAECSSTTGESLSTAFIENLRKLGVVVENMRGQGYDGASNMAGKYRGVQARIRAMFPEAVYTHCKAHCLNLAIIHASKDPYARNMMNVVQTVAFAFNYSAKRLLRFQEQLENDPVSREEMNERTKLQSLCETRWAARADALHTFVSAYRTVVTSLEQLAAEGDSKAQTYVLSVLQFDFIITLVTIDHVLAALVPLSKTLQSKTCDLLTAVRETKIVRTLLKNERDDPLVWDALFNKAVDIARDVDVQPSLPRHRGQQRNRPNAPAQTPSDFWKANMYYTFVDHLQMELEDRLLQGQERFKAQWLIPAEVQRSNLPENDCRELFRGFATCLPCDEDTFLRECAKWRVWWTSDALADGRPTAPTTLEGSLSLASSNLYPHIRHVLTILLVMPVSTATAERSFSTMRRVKTYLRNTMGTDRLSGLGLMNIYRDKPIDSGKVVDIFANRKPRRLALLFRI